PARSVVIGTDKRGGIAVYDLTGREIQYRPDAEINNVDLRESFPLGDEEVTLVTAGNWTDNTLEVYRLDPSTRRLTDVAGRPIEPELSINGSCMYRSPESGKTYAFVNSQSGEVEQWELVDDGSGRVEGRPVRSFEVGDEEIEGCVADDEHARLYISEEDRGIWSYGAEPDDGDRRRLVDSARGDGRLTPDAEGLAIADHGSGGGYLVASSQGDNSFTTYRRTGANEYVSNFRVRSGGGVDGVNDTDGIEVSTASFGPDLPTGMLVVQDGTNDEGNQNFKLVPWGATRR
ncbi:MAG: phytase, partial [Solirubrobacterales bacterium]